MYSRTPHRTAYLRSWRHTRAGLWDVGQPGGAGGAGHRGLPAPPAPGDKLSRYRAPHHVCPLLLSVAVVLQSGDGSLAKEDFQQFGQLRYRHLQ